MNSAVAQISLVERQETAPRSGAGRYLALSERCE